MEMMCYENEEELHTKLQHKRLSDDEIRLSLSQIEIQFDIHMIPPVPFYCFTTIIEIKTKDEKELYIHLSRGLQSVLSLHPTSYLTFLVNETEFETIKQKPVSIYQYGFQCGISHFGEEVVLRFNLFEKDKNTIVIEIQRRRGDTIYFYKLFHSFVNIWNQL